MRRRSGRVDITPFLAGPVVAWPSLASVQAQYVAAGSEPERRAAAVAFLVALRELADDGETAARSDELERIVNAKPVSYNPKRDRARAERQARALQAEWRLKAAGR